MGQIITPNRTIDATNGVTHAYRRYGKPGTVPVAFMQHFRGTTTGTPRLSMTSHRSAKLSSTTRAESGHPGAGAHVVPTLRA